MPIFSDNACCCHFYIKIYNNLHDFFPFSTWNIEKSTFVLRSTYSFRLHIKVAFRACELYLHWKETMVITLSRRMCRQHLPSPCRGWGFGFRRRQCQAECRWESPQFWRSSLSRSSEDFPSLGYFLLTGHTFGQSIRQHGRSQKFWTGTHELNIESCDHPSLKKPFNNTRRLT